MSHTAGGGFQPSDGKKIFSPKIHACRLPLPSGSRGEFKDSSQGIGNQFTRTFAMLKDCPGNPHVGMAREPHNKIVGEAAGRHPLGTSVDVHFVTSREVDEAFYELCISRIWRNPRHRSIWNKCSAFRDWRFDEEHLGKKLSVRKSIVKLEAL